MRFPDDVPTLTDGDVTLRAHDPGDAPAVVEQCLDPVSIRWTTVPLGYTLADASEFLTSSIAGGWTSGREFTFAIETTHPGGDRRFSGTVSLRDEGHRRAELAFGAHPAVRGRGVMTTAVNLLLDWGFKTQDLETVIWWANRGNVGSRRVAWKTGFTFGGTVRRWLDHRGEYPDAWVASLHRDDSREPKTRWLETPQLHGERVTLRPLAEADAVRIVEGCGDQRTQHFLPFLPRPYTGGDALEYLVRNVEEASLGSGVSWAVADPNTDALLAVVGIPRLGRSGAEIGYWAHPDARSRGVVSDALATVVRHAFVGADAGGLDVERVFLKAAASNPASQQVARNNGFTECGRERGSERLGDGSAVDMLLFDLLREEWEIREKP
ncbi:MAG: GNAT family N-acetyltransferase [Nocardioidaceae bacterium]